jgi:hypothetical protein
MILFLWLFWTAIIKWRPNHPSFPSAFSLFGWTPPDPDFENDFNSRRRFKQVWNRVELAVTSIYSYIRSISSSTFLDLTQPFSTFRGLHIWLFRSISASTFRDLQRTFVRLIWTFSTFLDLFRPSNSRDQRDSLGRPSQKSTTTNQKVPLDRLSRPSSGR